MNKATATAQKESATITVNDLGLDDNSGMDDELQALLNDVSATDENIEEIVEEVGSEVVEDAVEKLEAKETAVSKKKRAVKAKAKKPVEAKAPKAEKEPKTPHVSLAHMKASDAIRTILGANLNQALVLDDTEKATDANTDKHLSAIDSLAKKTRAKAVNLIKFMYGTGKLECYTQQALSLLFSKGEMTSEDLRNSYLARPYGKGTASAQSSQLMSLLPALNIAERDGKGLVLNNDNPLVGKLKTVIS